MGRVQEYAFLLLREIYNDSKGNIDDLVDVHKIVSRLNLDEDLTRSAASYLDRRYLITDRRIVGPFPVVSITASGIDAIEGALEHPSSPTQHFPAVYSIRVENMIGGAIQQGTISSSQTVGNTSLAGVDLGKLARELTQLRAALADEASSAEQYAALGSIAEAEVAAQKGDSASVATALSKLGSAGKWVAGVAEKIGVSTLASVLGRFLFG